MTPQELKNSILQLAIQGRLVEQRPEEGTAEELLIENHSSPTKANDSLEIPESWSWALLPELAEVLYGFPFDAHRFNTTNTGMPIIRIRDVLSGKTNTFSDEDCDERYRIKNGDMLVGMDGNFQVAFWKSEDAWLNQRVCRVSAKPSILDQRYLFYYLPFVLKEINGTVSYSTVKHLSAKLINSIKIPLPPLAEQKRIVAKIEELLPYIDRYEKAWSRLEDFNKRFPTDMQKSILQLAIQGKLVPQRPEEGTGEALYRQIQAEKQSLIRSGQLKKEKPLPEITPDEIPFDIPESWIWAKLADVCAKITDGEHKTPCRVDSFCGYYLLSARNVRDGFISLDDVDYVDEEEYSRIAIRCNPKKNDVLISCSGSVGRCSIVSDDNKYVMVRSAAMVSPLSVDSTYLMYSIQSDAVQRQIRDKTKQTAQANLFQDAIRNLIIPLPSVTEQKRIVAKLEELLPLCNRLK